MLPRTTVLVLFSLALTIALCDSGAGQPASEKSRQAALQILSKARPDIHWDSKSVVTEDIDCDGRIDHAYLGHEPGKIYVGLVRAADPKPQILEFRVSAGYQDAICTEPATLGPELLLDDLDAAKRVRKVQPSRICMGLVLSDDACDSIHFSWNHATKQLNWSRN
jgi:hypothetical protein